MCPQKKLQKKLSPRYRSFPFHVVFDSQMSKNGYKWPQKGHVPAKNFKKKKTC